MRVETSSGLKRFGEYELTKLLGRGGMAEVYEARRIGPHGFTKRLALKRLLPQLAADPRLARMFCEEARIQASLSHPNLVQVVDFGEQDGELFMTMEPVEGMSCAKLPKPSLFAVMWSVCCMWMFRRSFTSARCVPTVNDRPRSASKRNCVCR